MISDQMIKLLNLMIGGSLGTLARYSLTHITYHFLGEGFPYGTLIVNLTGCFIIGILATFSSGTFFLTYNHRILLVTGFCGAFTTFSTFIFDSAHLVKEGEILKACLNIILSIGLGFVVFKVGEIVGKTL